MSVKGLPYCKCSRWTSGWTGRGGGRTGGRSCDQGDGRADGQGDQGRVQENGRNQNGDAVNDNIQSDVRNVIENNDHRGCTYKEFLACNPKEYDGKGGAIDYTCWIEKMKSIRIREREAAVGMSWEHFKTLNREEFCPSNEMQKLETELWNHAMVGAGHAAYIDRFHELARLVPHLIRGMVAAIEQTTIQKAVPIAGTLTDEALRNGSIEKNPEKRGNEGEPSKDRNGSDDNKRTKTGNAFATTANPVRREYTGMTPKNVNPINARNPTARACYECGSTDHVKSACPRLNPAQRPGGNHQNQVVVFNGGQGRGNNGIESYDLGFSYEIEIASGQLVEINKVIKGCKLEIESHVFDINLIPFGSGSFDMIKGLD
ncbi:putative reverse transcriptase domain-containing protein [Tanacetum coccineum]